MHEIQVSVRFCETDALGHINNTSYFIYLEEARIRFMDMIGQNMDIDQWNFILASVKCDFINQGYFNQTLSIRTYVTKVGTKSFQLEHDISDSETGEPVAKGYAVMVCFNFGTQSSESLPEIVRKGLEQNLSQSV